MTRKEVVKSLLAGAASMGLSVRAFAESTAFDELPRKRKGNIRHSVCRWCYGKIPLEELVIAAKGMGISSIDLLKPDEWAVAARHGLSCAMAYASDMGLARGFNDPSLHAKLLDDYQTNIPKAAAAGLNRVICFSGNANGLSREQGLENCARGLEPVLKIAQKHGVTVVMELLNSKVDHKDYQCDRTEWGVALCEKLGSEHFKLLYDIYHMQIMEGDVIRSITDNLKYIAHFHTAGVPGRHEIDESQELYYPAIMRAIAGAGFQGFVAQEFIPASDDPLRSLRKSIDICDV